MRSRVLVPVLLLLAALAALAPAATAAPAGTQSRAQTVKVLQLNICHSGLAGCFSGDDALNKAVSVISETAPQVLSVNESCSGDADALGAAFGAGQVVFAAARHADGSPVLCKNGQEYGNTLMVADGLAGGPAVSGVYTKQDSGSEKRVWACLPAGALSACTTHLSANDGDIALTQCQELMAKAADYAATAPVVVSGDMNLRYQGDPNVQDCNRSGFYRKGDGDLQHVFASTNLTFVDGTAIDMDGTTDHPGWLVTVTMG